MILTEEQIKSIADKIRELKLVTPFVFFLEAHLPINTIFYNISLGLCPVFSGVKGFKTLPMLLSDRANVEKLIEELHS